MQVRYKNTFDDLIALQKFVLRHSAAGRRMMVHRYIMVEIVILFVFGMFAVNGNIFKVMFGFIAASTLAWLFRERSVLLQFRRDFKREIKKDKENSFFKDRLMTIDPEALTVQIGDRKQRHQWSTVEGAGKDSSYIYIVLKGLLHYVVPIAQLADEKYVQELYETINRHLSDSRQEI